MRYEIILSPEAVDDLRGIRADKRARVRDGIELYLRFEPTQTSRSRIKRLRGLMHPEYRLRIEGVRVFYDVFEDSVEVLAIVPKEQADAWLEKAGAADQDRSLE